MAKDQSFARAFKRAKSKDKNFGCRKYNKTPKVARANKA